MDFEKTKKIGSGTFGVVFLGKHRKRDEKVVVKKVKDESYDAKARCFKEAALLNNAKGHINIVKFLGFCDEPRAIMMEYASFDFRQFGVENSVCTLEDFFHFVDDEFEFNSFADVMPKCAKDIVTGLQHLHHMHIAHRDLKPGNILVSNQHYSTSKLTEDELSKAFGICPIICKLADFGLSRAIDLQTKSFLKSKTESVCRGTEAFMAPEIHLQKLVKASQEELKSADMWSLGLTMYSMLNPNLSGPYKAEFEQQGIIVTEAAFKETMERETLPKMDEKYEMLQVTEWWQVLSAFNLCCVFAPEFRPSASEVLNIFQRSDTCSDAFHLFPLSVSQATALEQHDHELALALNSENLDKIPKDMEPLLNDGTNCCAFLALEMCDRFLHETECAGNTVLPCSWNRLKEAAEDIIISFPEKVSELREVDKLYDVSEANTILANSKRLSSQYELSEECTAGNTVFSTGGRAELMRAITAKIPLCSHDNPIMIGVYTCSPYIFTLGIYNNALFLVDTHPITEDLGGNGNGLIMATQDCSERSCELLVQWILKRLQHSGVKGNELQSFCWVTRPEGKYKQSIIIKA